MTVHRREVSDHVRRLATRLVPTSQKWAERLAVRIAGALADEGLTVVPTGPAEDRLTRPLGWGMPLSPPPVPDPPEET